MLRSRGGGINYKSRVCLQVSLASLSFVLFVCFIGKMFYFKMTISKVLNSFFLVLLRLLR